MNDSPNPSVPQRWSEDLRSTESIKLRLTPDVAIALRLAAKQRGISISEYVSALVLTSGASNARGDIALADVSRLAFSVNAIPDELKRLRNELGWQGGLAKHLFLTGGYRDHAEQTGAVLDAVRDVTLKTESFLHRRARLRT